MYWVLSSSHNYYSWCSLRFIVASCVEVTLQINHIPWKYQKLENNSLLIFSDKLDSPLGHPKSLGSWVQGQITEAVCERSEAIELLPERRFFVVVPHLYKPCCWWTGRHLRREVWYCWAFIVFLGYMHAWLTRTKCVRSCWLETVHLRPWGASSTGRSFPFCFIICGVVLIAVILLEFLLALSHMWCPAHRLGLWDSQESWCKCPGR